MLAELLREPRIAYFTMEIALRYEVPTYAGGLGILAGDTVRSAADLDVPLVAVSLISRTGYFRQEIDVRGGKSSATTSGIPSSSRGRLRPRSLYISRGAKSGCAAGCTSWKACGGTAASLYDKLETTILPLYRSGPRAWAPLMRGTIGKNAAYFNSHRMMRRYAIEAYIR